MHPFLKKIISKKDRGATIVFSLLFLVFCSVFCGIIITSVSTLGGTIMSNEKYEAKLLAESALKAISSCFAKKEIEYDSEMGIGELEILTEEAGMGFLNKVYANALYEIENNDIESYSTTFVMKVSNENINLILKFVMFSGNYDLEFEIMEIYIDHNEVIFSGLKKLKFKGDLYTEIHNDSSHYLVYDDGEYC